MKTGKIMVDFIFCKTSSLTSTKPKYVTIQLLMSHIKKMNMLMAVYQLSQHE